MGPASRLEALKESHARVKRLGIVCSKTLAHCRVCTGAFLQARHERFFVCPQCRREKADQEDWIEAWECNTLVDVLVAESIATWGLACHIRSGTADALVGRRRWRKGFAFEQQPQGEVRDGNRQRA